MESLSCKKVWLLDGAGLDHSKEIEHYEANNIDYLISTKESMNEDFYSFGRDADVLVAEASILIDEKLINQLSSCKGIVSFGTGYNHINIRAAQKRNIVVCHLNYCSEEVADHTLSLILMLLRRLSAYDKNLKSGIWNSISAKPIHRFRNVTIGLLGFGKIAQKVATRLLPFGFKIIVHDEYVDQSLFQKHGVTPVSLDKLLQQSNVLSLHVPLTKETSNLLNKENMRTLPENAIIVNTCRGGIIDEDALVQLIKEEHLSGAGLDVFLSEPPDMTQELFLMDEIILTPHAGYYSLESIEEMQTQSADSAIKIMKNEKPAYTV
ncbi:C-terminal binding protein [Virgibacillus sp. NKC19-3]|uniref:C-terminal binding protein n=1 Tax=Virgibacillus saliphilus TaxID=2831674 RepID=UPI001C9AF6A6|nr:C-terminal binding protein [Virgibacillus sp. NKC19-3]MBY7144522.1 C-terminal binding protein [Virgibacillus sp. NKC19-3]